MAVEEKVFYTEKKEVLDREHLKMMGYKYESSSTLGIDKKGLFLIIKAESNEFETEQVKKERQDTEEVKGEEKNKILENFKELEENAAGGITMFD